jgi:hypothetical protein
MADGPTRNCHGLMFLADVIAHPVFAVVMAFAAFGLRRLVV